jgi:outer membrane protein insertion porin family
LRSRLSYEFAGLGGNFEFMKFGYYNTFYHPVCPRGVLKMRADIQFIHTYGHTHPTTLPLSERLFVGGETTVRGYRNFIIGPKYDTNEPRGGVSCYLISEEYQHNLLKAPCVDAFVFCDAGFLSLSEFTIGRQAASVGFGLRIEVMRDVPITLGMGYPIHPVEKRTVNGVTQRINNAQRFFFSVGGCF